MQISRHWRMQSNRYRLEGVRYGNGKVSLQERPVYQYQTPAEKFWEMQFFHLLVSRIWECVQERDKHREGTYPLPVAARK